MVKYAMEKIKLTDPSNYGGLNRGRVFIILHGTGKNPSATAEAELNYLRRPGIGVSYHYYVTKSGEVHQLVPDNERAWHAGSSAWSDYRDLNDWSIGVAFESSNGVNEEYPEAQQDAAFHLVRNLMNNYGIEAANVLTHREVSVPVGRKVDPVGRFDIDDFRARLGGPTTKHIPAYHPITNDYLGEITIVDGRKAYPHWLKAL